MSSEQNKTIVAQPQLTDPDEINLLEYLYVLVKNKWLIIGMVILGFSIGYIAAKLKGPVFIADAVIAPKESESVNVPNLSGLGMFGGMMANQLSVGGNASLEKIELLLDGRTFNEKFVVEKNIDSILAPTLYPTIWDTIENNWLHDTLVPRAVSVGGFVKSELLEKEISKTGTMSIKITHEDSLVAYTILTNYLDFLDSYIRETTQKDAKENRDYLEEQLINVSDPLLRASLLELIAKEVEKEMVVSKEAFRVVDDALVGKSFKEKKLYPIIFCFLFGFIAVFLVIIVHALGSGDKTEEDKGLLIGIKKEFLKLPFVR